MKKLIDKRIITVVSIVLGIGFLFGIVFLITTSSFDKILIKSEITDYLSMLQEGKNITLATFLNSFKSNFIYILLITIFSIVYFISPLILFINFYKGMVLGFYAASIVLAYKVKGVFIALAALFPHHLIMCILIIVYSSIMLKYSLSLVKATRDGENLNIRLFIKRISILFIIALLMCLASTLLELFLNSFIISLIL